jgi:hypothetical protein
MKRQGAKSGFEARVLRPRDPGPGKPWAFVVLPKEVSARLPRRGRISVEGAINGKPFVALLEPDGRKSHWLRIDASLIKASGAAIGKAARFEVAALEPEPDPQVPADLLAALEASPDSKASWGGTTTVARVDWIHWITSAKQQKTRAKRIKDACEMLASGKKRVCCFDPSGFYSKAFSAPRADE